MRRNSPTKNQALRSPAASEISGSGDLPVMGFLRLKDIIGPGGFLPISRSSFYAGIQKGLFPKPVKLGPRTAGWRKEDIVLLIQRLEKGEV